MLFAVTGVPGASKTLNTVKMLREDKDYKDRVVYYHNIKEVVFTDWIELSDDEALRWYELPKGSIILFDEAQGLFPACKPKANEETPKFISELNTSRHLGLDLFFITQHPSLLDVRLRRLIAPHYHYDRAFGSKLVTQFIFKKCALDPDDYHAKKDASRSSKVIDKKYFGTYKSTELDTHKFKPPKKLVAVIVFTIGFLLYVAYFASSYLSDSDSDLPNGLSSDSGNISSVSGSPLKASTVDTHSFAPVYPVDPNAYLALYKPRISGIASTAPIYDQLTIPVAFPKTLCIRKYRNGKKVCSCYTQQASKLVVDQDTCNALIDNRRFDPTIPDPSQIAIAPYSPPPPIIESVE